MRHLLPALAVLALSGAPALAQTAPASAPAAAGGMQIEASHLRAKQLIDRDVYTTDNVEVGEIEDLVIDPATGRVVSVVVEVENRLGLTDRYVSVNMNQLRIAAGERRVTIDMTRDGVRSLRGINYGN